VIKGTEVYNSEKGGTMDLSILDVMQIFGRAGRPQFDTSGEATLITSHDGLARYLDKLVREVPIESSFIKQLADHLNAEVVGGTVTNISEAAEWLMYTYLHVRMTKNPIAYGINASESESDPTLRGRSLELVRDAAKLLDSYMMLRFDQSSGNLAVTDLGRVASHFYIRAESVSRFNEMLQRKFSPTDADLLDIICNANEFENVKVRPEEMEELEKLMKEECPLEVKSPIEDYQGKCCVLMQAFISGSRIRSFTLTSDSNYIASNAGRVARALFEMCLKRGSAGAALKLLRIAKSADKRIWWFQTPLRQFDKELAPNIYRALESRINDAKTESNAFEYAISLLDMHSSEVGQLCHSSKDGKKVQSFVSYLPQIDVSCNVQPVTRAILRFQVTLTPIFTWSQRWHGGSQGFWLWIEDSSNNRM
jgi:activating signal cointegrator complex subunit 3